MFSLPFCLYGSASSEVCYHLSILYTDLNYLRANTQQLLGAGREINLENRTTIFHGGFTSGGLGEEKTSNDSELPFLKFQDILVATDNFSNVFMIGQGGFGKVYKVLKFTMEVPTFAFP